MDKIKFLYWNLNDIITLLSYFVDYKQRKEIFFIERGNEMIREITLCTSFGNLMYYYATLNIRHDLLFETICNEIVYGRKRHYNISERVNIIWSLLSLNYEHTSWGQSVIGHFIEQFQKFCATPPATHLAYQISLKYYINFSNEMQLEMKQKLMNEHISIPDQQIIVDVCKQMNLSYELDIFDMYMIHVRLSNTIVLYHSSSQLIDAHLIGTYTLMKKQLSAKYNILSIYESQWTTMNSEQKSIWIHQQFSLIQDKQ
jgi:hypothetical protein